MRTLLLVLLCVWTSVTFAGHRYYRVCDWGGPCYYSTFKGPYYTYSGSRFYYTCPNGPNHRCYRHKLHGARYYYYYDSPRWVAPGVVVGW